ncbi:hypothetical protein [uncultured Polaribacter sp.]|uniref:hypothetical protein n=1 Tax=uncultured Polaribacter sp. TaxID=174711 RepID=UPI002605EE7B|nr:hypothetical protein [uncultured Polaribacter sp.]
MKILFYSCCLLFFLSCKKEKPQKQKALFLVGDWVRINDKKGSTTYEKWDANLKGIGYTLTEKDTTFKEILSIINLKDSLYLKVEGVNEKPTLFKFTHVTDTSFICENKQNDFPKKINYFLKNNQLNAIVSADDFKIEFVFNKKGM